MYFINIIDFDKDKKAELDCLEENTSDAIRQSYTHLHLCLYERYGGHACTALLPFQKVSNAAKEVFTMENVSDNN